MADQKDNKDSERQATLSAELSGFLKGFEGLGGQFVQNARQLVEEEELIGLTDTYGNVLRGEIAGVSDRVLELFSTVDDDSASEASRFLRDSGAAVLVEQASSLVGANRLRSTNALGRFGGIFELIKKIITQLVDLIFGRVPRWLDKLLHIIDNLLGLIGGLFSRQAQDYYYRLERNELRIRADLRAIGA